MNTGSARTTGLDFQFGEHAIVGARENEVMRGKIGTRLQKGFQQKVRPLMRFNRPRNRM